MKQLRGLYAQKHFLLSEHLSYLYGMMSNWSIERTQCLSVCISEYVVT